MKKLELLIIFFYMQLHAHQVDLIIFSYDRPLQLYALLESTYILIKGLNDIFVIYRSSNSHFERGYEIIKQEFPCVHYIQQGSNPAHDFKSLTIKAFQANATSYVLFAVDDIVVKDEIDLTNAIAQMEKHQAYGFYFRLGHSLNYSYMQNKFQPLPQFKSVDEGCYLWQFSNAAGYWRYPHTVDMTIYRKEDIAADVLSINYTNPNSFEGWWANRASSIMGCDGICYEQTKVVNLPLNKVNNSENRHMNFMTTQELLDLFFAGKKMDILPLFRIQNKSAHMEYVPTFIEREY